MPREPRSVTLKFRKLASMTWALLSLDGGKLEEGEGILRKGGRRMEGWKDGGENDGRKEVSRMGKRYSM